MSAPLQVVLPAAMAAAIGFYLVFVSIGRLAPAYRARFDAAVSRQLARAHLYVAPQRLLALNLGTAAAAALLALWLGGGPVAAALAALASGMLPRLLLAWLRRRRAHAFRQQLSDLMMLAAGCMRAGLGLTQALAQTAAEMDAPARQEIDLMLREQRLGASFDEALTGLERRMPMEETALLCAAMRISRATGGNLAETLESLGDAIRRKVAIEGKIRALTAQGRLQGWAMGLLPVLCAGLLWVVEPTAMAALFTTWYGLATCAVVVVMQLLGLYFMRRVMRIDV
ncbi:MAG TPA: type II secretion system F family protein [Quisquiliibacterium sp.]|nr:type II secretion system F family protein [Quisquiliibacterium sp.]